MTALMRKDIYTLTKQLKLFLVFLIVFSLLPGYNMSAFAIIYSSFLPMTALAYDERAKWDQLAVMMPYTPRQLVVSKYLLGYIGVICAFALSLAAQGVMAAIQKQTVPPENLVSLGVIVLLAFLLQAINLPFLFKLGAEKGRLVFLVLVTAVTIAGFTLSERVLPWLEAAQISLLRTGLGLLLLVILGTIFSMGLSTKFYAHRQG